MPYIKPEDRTRLDWNLSVAENAGELNYLLTGTIKDYLTLKGLSYQTINDIVGALEGAKAEFQRRIVAPYEDTKIAENTDVY